MFSTALTEYHMIMVVLAVVNAVIGIFYYLKVIVAMYFKSAEPKELQSSAYFNFVLGFSALLTIIVGIYPSIISNLF
jgi:NADH-quinone oxidoreductase subunit N